jgi:hypothetical protein
MLSVEQATRKSKLKRKKVTTGDFTPMNALFIASIKDFGSIRLTDDSISTTTYRIDMNYDSRYNNILVITNFCFMEILLPP